MLFSHVDICFKKRGSRNERCCAEKKERNACMTVQIWGSKWFQRETVEHEIEQRCESIKLLSSPIRIRITKIISSPIFDRYYFFVFKPIAIPMKDSITFFWMSKAQLRRGCESAATKVLRALLCWAAESSLTTDNGVLLAVRFITTLRIIYPIRPWPVTLPAWNIREQAVSWPFTCIPRYRNDASTDFFKLSTDSMTIFIEKIDDDIDERFSSPIFSICKKSAIPTTLR